MSNQSQAAILIIVGITGDLSRRKLVPAIEQIAKAQALPTEFKVVGISRQDITPSEVVNPSQYPHVAGCLEMFKMDLDAPADYQALDRYLGELAQGMASPVQRLFYLSVPPQISRPIVERLGESGIAAKPRTKLLLEKPFGTDLESAKELVDQARQYFAEEQLYRIDHYLAKEMAQNLIVFRQGNSLFKRTWNREFIESIEVVATEKIGIEGRATFYEQTGALRDLVQSHLLQLAALTLMATPKSGELQEVPAHRLEALRHLRIPQSGPLAEFVKRGQYKGYRTEAQTPNSNVETYVNLRLESTDPLWEGVPIYLTTGKAMATKTTEIRITYRRDEAHEANQLVIRFQPNEGVEVCLWTKVPGYEWKVEQHALHLAFKDHFKELPEAYEQVLVDAINSNHTLFTSSAEVLESWRIIAPIQAAWDMSAADLAVYEPGAVEV